MRRCLSCNAIYPAGPQCAVCGWGPGIIDGFEAYAPAFAHGGAGYEPSHVPVLAGLEDGNFWFEARNELISWALEKYVPKLVNFLEIGCGTGFVLRGIDKNFPGALLSGSEIYTAGLAFAAARVPHARLIQMDARDIPFREEFDAVGAFDVLEHIEDDATVLTQMWHALKPEGHCILTVPQHQWLWSDADERAGHVRRYSVADLHAKLRDAGFSIRLSTSFVSLLLPVMVLSRSKNKARSSKSDPLKQFKLPPIVNATFYRVMRAELRLIAAGGRFPAGGSRLVMAQKA